VTDPLDRLLARVAPEPDDGAADRVLAGLRTELVAGALAAGELERAARRALWPSGLLALAGVLTLGGWAVVQAHRPGGHLAGHLHHAKQLHAPSEDHTLVLAGASVRDARRLALPFAAAPSAPEKR
jgi:hypothetical protein